MTGTSEGAGRGYVRGCETVNLTHGYFAAARRVTHPARSGTVAVKAEREPFGPVSGAKVHHDSRRPPAAWCAVDRPGAPGVVVRPASAAWEPSRRDTYGLERPHRRGGWSATVPDTVADTPPSPCCTSGKKRGPLPSSQLWLARHVLARTRRKTRTATRENCMWWPDTHTALFLTPPPLSVSGVTTTPATTPATTPERSRRTPDPHRESGADSFG